MKTNNRDRVSVIIPTFNRAYCVSNAIDSALAQTHSNIEVLVIDDGSTDDTGDLISKRYAGEPRVHYLRQENQGVSAARNRGLRECRGDFVAFLDSDDTWKPWKLDLQLAALRHMPQAGMIWTDMEAIDGSGRVVEHRYLRKMYSAWRWFTPAALFSFSVPIATFISSAFLGLPKAFLTELLYVGDLGSPMIMGNLVHTSTVLMRRERQHQVGEFNKDLRFSGEDYDFHLRTCRVGPVAFLDVPTIQYRVGSEDRLTRPELSIHMAQNFLDTIRPIVEFDRASIELPNWMIRRVFAEGYAWLGENQLDAGDNRSAARSLFRSLWNNPWQLRVAALASLALLPPKAAAAIRSSVRRLRRLLA